MTREMDRFNGSHCIYFQQYHLFLLRLILLPRQTCLGFRKKAPSCRLQGVHRKRSELVSASSTKRPCDRIAYANIFGSSLFPVGNLRLPISEVHHARSFFEFDQEAIDSDSRSNEINSREPCHGFDLVDQLRTQIYPHKTARSR